MAETKPRLSPVIVKWYKVVPDKIVLGGTTYRFALERRPQQHKLRVVVYRLEETEQEEYATLWCSHPSQVEWELYLWLKIKEYKEFPQEELLKILEYNRKLLRGEEGDMYRDDDFKQIPLAANCEARFRGVAERGVWATWGARWRGIGRVS